MSLPNTTWCSPSNPQGTCDPQFLNNKEVCKPMDFDTLAVFKGIQQAVNVLLKQDNKSTIRVDGRIGPATVAAVNVYSSTPFRDCNEMAKVSPETLAELKKLAAKRAIAVPDRAAIPKASKAGFPFIPALLIFGALGGYLYYEDQKGKKKRKTRKKRSK